MFALSLKAQVPLFPDSAGLYVNKINLNSNEAEFSPYLWENQLYFVSDRPWQFGVVSYEDGSRHPFSDLYVAAKKDSCRFVKSKNLTHPLNSQMNDGPFCITPKGIYITTNNSSAGIKKNGAYPLQISFSDRNSDNKYAKPKRISFDLPDSISVGHPSVSGDTIMFLVSDKAGGKGGADIYFSKFTDGKWSTPVNCGDIINTAHNEEFPYFFEGKLYFSSDRPGGFGGLDLYVAERKKGEFEMPSVLANPVNSQDDDFSLFINKEKNNGYFASNRYGTDDIFYFSRDAALDFSNCADVKFTQYCYTFFEENSKTSTDTVGLYYEWNFGDGKKAKGSEVSHCFSGEGKYTIELNVIDRSTGEVFYNELSYDLEIKNPEQLFIDMPDSIKVGTEIKFDPSFSYISNYIISKYSWNFGDDHFAFEEAPKHQFNDPGTFVINLKTEGSNNGVKENHCVSRVLKVLPSGFQGKLSSSRKLPLGKRTDDILNKKVIDSLFKADPDLYLFIKEKIKESDEKKRDSTYKGPSKNKIEAGGDSSVIKFNSSPADSNANFRVHIVTSDKQLKKDDPFFLGLDSISEVKTRKLYQYFYGRFNSPAKALEAVKKLKELGFSPFVFSFDKDSMVYTSNPNLNKILFAPDSSRWYIDHDSITEIVYFETNMSELSDRDLQKLTHFARKYKKVGLSFDLFGYTDYKGTSEYNLKLCKKRLETVNNILKQNGVITGKIKVKPIGPVKDLNEEDTEIARRHNRRVEVHVKLKQ